jgi:uncharacterized coiled-coil protein SlyX
MAEDPTQKLPDSRPFEERVLAELAAIRSGQAALETRMTALEEKVDARLRETRPIWESVQQQLTTLDARMTTLEARMAAMEKTLNLIRVGLGELYGDSVEVRARIALLERERTPAG